MINKKRSKIIIGLLFVFILLFMSFSLWYLAGFDENQNNHNYDTQTQEINSNENEMPFIPRSTSADIFHGEIYCIYFYAEEGTSISYSVDVEAGGPVGVYLVPESEVDSIRSGEESQYFSEGSTENTESFMTSFRIPEDGNYAIVIHRTGIDPSTVNVLYGQNIFSKTVIWTGGYLYFGTMSIIILSFIGLFIYYKRTGGFIPYVNKRSKEKVQSAKASPNLEEKKLKYKSVWQVVGALCFVGIFTLILGFEFRGFVGVILASGGAAFCIGSIAGVYSDGVGAGFFYGWLIGGPFGWFMGGFFGLLFGWLVGTIVGGIIGIVIGWWSDKKKEEIDEKLESTHKRREIKPAKPKPNPRKFKRNNVEKKRRNYAEIMVEIDELQGKEEMIDTRAIKSALEEGDIARANDLLDELKEEYGKYRDIIEELNSLEDGKDKLSLRLAEGEISEDSFRSAKESIENRKDYLQNRLEKLKKKVINED